ncbi:MAG: MFS transporter [Gemmatimonadaceae bacterium]
MNITTTSRRLLTLSTVLACACTQALKVSPSDAPTVLSHQLINAPNPGEKGSFAVKTMYYGSGNDKRRAEFRDSVTLKTKTVDASPFVSMEPNVAKDREKDWGFGTSKFPINGRVWYPAGNGPFPLVLIVHGNHDPLDYSDPGYGYLGELLASRGFILVSVDENFINGSLRGESDGRAWMLLKHLEVWKRWNDSTAGPFSHKVDMNNIGIMGHSRGGEAVGIAAAFNRLSHYPDDANIKFNFNFNIRAVFAIAPVDGQYKPAGVPTPIENVNYMVIHGSHDGDVSSFGGLRAFQRIKFTDGKPWFKTAWYVYRANHGQWNTVWGNKDNGPRSGRYLDLRGLISPDEQRQFSKVVISGFLEATLHGKSEYLPMFRDHRLIGAWLPKTMYITRFQESGFSPLATFDEDVDVTTGSVPGVTISGDSLATWKENPLNLRSGANDPINTNAVTLGWNNHIRGDDTTKLGKAASYTIALSDSLVNALHVGDTSSIYMSIAPTSARPGPRAPARDTTKKADSTKKDSKNAAPKPPPKKDVKPDSTPVDFTIEMTDASGHIARLPITRFGVPRRPLEIHILRRADEEKQRYPTQYELVLQTYVMPLADFAKAAPGFDASHLRSIRIVFDKLVAGTIVVDDIGVSSKAGPFTAVEMP